MNLFIQLLTIDPQLFFYQVFVVIFSVCLHEYAHAGTALFFGDDTAEKAGHLTLNPFRQMGIMSLLMLMFCGIAWGAVPVDPEKLKARHKKAELWVSLAGPLVNLMLFLAGTLIFTGIQVFLAFQEDVPGNQFLFVNLLILSFLFGKINGLLLILNLLPVPGFDGWNVVKELVPGEQKFRLSSE